MGIKVEYYVLVLFMYMCHSKCKLQNIPVADIHKSWHVGFIDYIQWLGIKMAYFYQNQTLKMATIGNVLQRL